MPETSGTANYTVGTETFQTWYRVIGDLSSGIRPLVTLHGGPGIAHNYMLPHVELCQSHGIPVVLYDQVGIGHSSHLRDKPKEFFTVELWMNELENLLAHLGITDDFDVVGHSWGGMLATSWICARHPPGLKRLVLVGTPAAMHLWEAGTHALLDGLPADVREALKKHEREVFYMRHVCKIDPRPEDLRAAKDAQMADPTVSATMVGSSAFDVTGKLKTWSVLDDLHTITQPTLVINGGDDEAQDVCVSPLFERIPKAKWVRFANSSHMPFFEEKERYLKIVSTFLTM